MSLDEQNTDPPYLLGRLFAVLEHAQGSATRSRELNKSLKERFFGSAMITPAQVFPTLLRGLTAHLGKLNKGAEVYFEKAIQEIHSQLPPEYPSRLNARDQGLFCVGYYHQRSQLFKQRLTLTNVEEAEK